MNSTGGGSTGFQNRPVEMRCYALFVVENVMSNLGTMGVSGKAGQM